MELSDSQQQLLTELRSHFDEQGTVLMVELLEPTQLADVRVLVTSGLAQFHPPGVADSAQYVIPTRRQS
jgi:hypothetical protein